MPFHHTAVLVQVELQRWKLQRLLSILGLQDACLQELVLQGRAILTTLSAVSFVIVACAGSTSPTFEQRVT